MTQTQQNYHPSAAMKHFSLGMLAGMCMLSASLMIHHNMSEGEIFATQSDVGPIDGVCGSANNSTLFPPVTFTTPGLCASGQISRIIMDGKSKKVYRNCIGDATMKNDRCEGILIPSKIINEERKENTIPEEVKKRNEARKSLRRQFRETSLYGR